MVVVFDRSKARSTTVSIPRPSRSTLNRPRASRSSLSHWMTVRSAMLAFSIGTRSRTGSCPSRKPPGWIERWRGKSWISEVRRERWRCTGDRGRARARELRRELARSAERASRPVQRGVRHVEHLAHLAHRRAGDSGPRWPPSPRGATVLLVHVLDHLFAAVVLDVEVDVRRLGPLPEMKRSKRRPIRTGSTAVIPRQ